MAKDCEKEEFKSKSNSQNTSNMVISSSKVDLDALDLKSVSTVSLVITLGAPPQSKPT